MVGETGDRCNVTWSVVNELMSEERLLAAWY